MFHRYYQEMLFPFTILLISFSVQTYLIFPIEQYLREDQLTEIVSLIFIPHGVKVLLAMVYGAFALPAIFTAQIINGFFLTGDIEWTQIYGAVAGTLCIGLPLILHNLSVNKPLGSSSIFDLNLSFNIFWLFISWAIISSFLNSILHSLIYGFPVDNLPWYFLFGDVFGSFILCLISMAIVRSVKMLGW